MVNVMMNDIIKKYESEIEDRRKAALRRLGERIFYAVYGISAAYLVNILAEAISSGEGSDYRAIIKKKLPTLRSVLSDDASRALDFALGNLRDYPYQTDMYRRPYRTGDPVYYAAAAAQAVADICRADLYGVDTAQAVSGDMPDDKKAYFRDRSWITPYCSWQIAEALDSGDERVCAAVKSALTEDTARVTRDLILGVLRSHRKDFYGLVCDLLLAARLQEGLRQAICESSDFGTKEAFSAILKTVCENGLVRFSAVKRAAAVWLGALPETGDAERVTQKTVDLMYSLINDPSACRVYIASEDTVKILCGLWRLAYDDAGGALSAAAKIALDGSIHQRAAAGFFCRSLGLRSVATVALSVIEKYKDEQKTVALWAPLTVYGMYGALYEAEDKNAELDACSCFASAPDALRTYRALCAAAPVIGSGAVTSQLQELPFFAVKTDRKTVSALICFSAAESGDDRAGDEACDMLRYCDTGIRAMLFKALCRKKLTDKRRDTAIGMICDKSPETAKAAYGIVKGLELRPDEYLRIENFSRYKSPDVRRYVTELLMKQDDGRLYECVIRLVSSDAEESRLAGYEIAAKRGKEFSQKAAEHIRRHMPASLSSKELIYIEKLDPGKKDADVPSADEDAYEPRLSADPYITKCLRLFVSYFPSSAVSPEDGTLKKTRARPFSGVCASYKQALEDLSSLSSFVELHAEDKYETGDGTVKLIGNDDYLFLTDRGDTVPCGELWKEWAERNGVEKERLLNALVASCECAFKSFTQGVSALYGRGFGGKVSLPYGNHVRRILSFLCLSIPEKERSMLASALAYVLVRSGGYDPEIYNDIGMSDYKTAYLFESCAPVSAVLSYFSCMPDADLIHTFPLSEALTRMCTSKLEKVYKDRKNGIPGYLRLGSDHFGIGDAYCDPYKWLYAAYAGAITDKQLHRHMLEPDKCPEFAQKLSDIASAYIERGRSVTTRESVYSSVWRARAAEDYGKGSDKKEELHRYAAHVYDDFVRITVGEELKRGDEPTKYSAAVMNLHRLYGAGTFVSILVSLGDDIIDRNAHYSWSSSTGRREVLSYLLCICVPSADDSAKTLAAALQGAKIGKKRLIEAAMFSREWIPAVGEYLGIPGFESACLYFTAHCSDDTDDRTRAMISRFTRLSPQELHDGCFDINWFREAYAAVGRQTFELIYDAAKYSADGSRHTRARKYADAAMNKLDPAAAEKLISEKRNKDLLMAYALIPLKDTEELCRRYLFISRFGKESRNFGAQRAASEKTAVACALRNLAENAGYGDPLRLTLSVEAGLTEKLTATRAQTGDGVTLSISVDGSGKASVVAEKDGKQLKTVPSGLKKDPAAAEVISACKQLDEQRKRAVSMFENAMTDGSGFTLGELCALSVNPAVGPAVRALVFTDGGVDGFVRDGSLVLPDGGTVTDPERVLRVAHPYDLYKAGDWITYQKYLFDNGIVQPFRQVFRELYVKTEDEKNGKESRRYAGNQIQPGKAAAILGKRGWTVTPDEGLTKVYHNAKLAVSIFAAADFFSPADIEYPTVEEVVFYGTETGRAVMISDVPDAVFSEVMRDIDLCVSAAHAGGVDPQASASTVEMRTALISYLLPLLRIGNVRLDPPHALIDGELARYSVHLGSGVVHQIGGTMIPVLPVHSQHKGKIFLPFADEDPKTAEILSKIILFSEDKKIKDPSVLQWIKY